MFLIGDAAFRQLIFSLIVSFLIVKYRPTSFGPSVIHILLILSQLIMAILSALLISGENMEKFKNFSNNEDRRQRLMIAAMIFSMIFLILSDFILLFNSSFSVLDLQTQNRLEYCKYCSTLTRNFTQKLKKMCFKFF